MSSEDSDVEAEDELLSEGLRKMLFIVEEFGGLTGMMLLPKMMLMLVKYDEVKVKPWWRTKEDSAQDTWYFLGNA